MADPQPDNDPKINLELRLPTALHDDFVKFCEWTRRDRPEMAREILQLFFADGFLIAFERLRAHKWRPGDGVEPYTDEFAAEFYKALGKDQKKRADPE